MHTCVLVHTFLFSSFYSLAAVFFLLISSAVTMAVPFGIGRVIDIIYSKADDGNMVKRLRDFCIVLLAVFICGAGANYGRVYFMQMAGK